MYLEYRNFIEECKQGIHKSEFATKLLTLHNLIARLDNVISEWNIARVDFCLALDEKEKICPPIILSHIDIISNETQEISLMLDSYINEYFNQGIQIEKKLKTNQSITNEEFDAFEKISKFNPFSIKPMANAESLLKAKCYVDIVSSLIGNSNNGIIDELDSLLILIASEFNTYFIENPDSFDKAYLKYSLLTTDENGLLDTLYDPAKARELRRLSLSKSKKLLTENITEEKHLIV